ncbi:YveK family protein [Paenibacillus hodogayensis]|uniref:YveK family protein n=1 Tax=Paenibacillus hodogayensis TaxID=279208 RepID=A0ABV5W930_9BACL
MDLELKEFLAMIRKRFWIIALIVLTVCLATAAVSLYVVKPVYSASTKLVVTNTNQYATGIVSLDLTTLTAQIKLVNTYKELITTAAIMDRVAEQHPELGLSSVQLSERVKVSTVEDSQVLTISVLNSKHENAVTIVNSVAELAKTEISKIMKADNITIVNPAKHSDNPEPVRQNLILILMMAFVASCLVSLGLVYLLEMLDDSLKNEKDIRQHLGLPVLASVNRITKKDLERYPASSSSKSRKVGEANYVGINQ